VNFGSRTRPSRVGRCSATPSGVRWSRTSSPLGEPRSVPEGVPQRCSGDKQAQSRLIDGNCETSNRTHRRVPSCAADILSGVVLTDVYRAFVPGSARICSGSLVRTSGLTFASR
jgi:hypothetical protein